VDLNPHSENAVALSDPRLAMPPLHRGMMLVRSLQRIQRQLPPTAGMALAAASAASCQTGREQMQHRSAMKHRLLDDLVGESK
jgi:hypothetical protein